MKTLLRFYQLILVLNKLKQYFLSESAEPGKNAGCFPEDSTVLLESGARISMSSLRVGDKIAAMDSVSGDLVYSEVIMFLDRDVDRTRSFVNILTESGELLSITDSHLVHVVKKDTCEKASCVETIFAGNVELGHHVLVNRDGNIFYDRVVKIDVKRLRGVYAPLTATGTLVVDNVVASAYAVIDSQAIAHAAFAPVRLANFVAENFNYLISAVTMAEPTVKNMNYNEISSNSIEIGENSDNTLSKITHRTMRLPSSDGIHWYANLLYSVADNILPGHLVNR